MTTPTLTRTLKLPSLVLFGLAYLTPLIVLGIFGIIAETTGGASPAAYLVAMVAMLFTAHSYGRMAVAYPVAGSAYTYVRRSIDPRVGFLVGWAILLDYLFLPMVIWLIGGSYLTAQFPGIPIGVWIVGFILITTVLNILGIKVADKANYVLMAFQMLVIVFFVALSIGNVVSTQGAGGLASRQPFFNDTSSFATISAGAAIAAYSFLGFDAVTTLTEETVNPRKNMPRAIRLIALIGGGIFVAVSYVTQLVHPGGVFEDSASAASAIALQIGGQLFGAVFLAGLVAAQFASGLVAQASASRLMYAMGRDSVLPKAVFGRLSAKFHTPVVNLVITGIVGLIAIFLDVATSTSFINFGAFTAFTLVNVSVVFHYVRRRGAGEQLNAVSYVVVPAVGAIICAYLLSQLDSNAITLGVSWLVLGVVVLALITRGFRAAPPEMTTTEKATVEAAAYAEVLQATRTELNVQAMEGTGVRIALGQLESGADIAANLAAIDRFAAQAAGDGATLVAFPEYATYEKKIVDASFPALAEPLDGPICAALSATAARRGIALVAGVVEASDEEGRAYNTMVAFGPDGERLAVYRKIHLFDAQGFGESTFIKPGPSTDPVVFEAGGVRFGLQTCYDLRFPELARSLADAGAEVLLVCSSWVPGTYKTEQWLALNAARAIENGVYGAGVCQTPPISVGRSVLVDPMGVVETDLGLEPGVRAVEISLSTVARVREQFPMFRQRRLG